jgi:septum formation protein
MTMLTVKNALFFQSKPLTCRMIILCNAAYHTSGFQMNKSVAANLIILASSSPYRRKLLERLELPFQSHGPDIDETPLPGESPISLVRRLAQEKADCTSRLYPGALVIGSDQVAVYGRNILNKPGSHAQARIQLQRLSGHNVRFHTGLCVINGSTGSVQVDCVTFKVKFRKLVPDEIERYLAAERPYDCAGSFKSEGLGVSLLASMQGDDATALVGLPLIRLCEMLRNEGQKLP